MALYLVRHAKAARRAGSRERDLMRPLSAGGHRQARRLLDVLRDAGLVTTRSEGRKRINALNAAPLREAIERWISKYEAYWSNTLLRVKESAESASATGKKSGRRRA